ncbi:hypothetical protein QCA50_007863 [Cerrena zonata]|uniref:Protein kinase domain-containing protein n=1 Tax=Cerrena zonata TaxID=2478898 RepID=A0AAW0GGU2_9APHY
MAKVVEDVTEQSASATLTKAGSARWLAPEVIEGEVEFPNHASDVYSFAMTMYECLSGGMPFPTLRRDAQVIHKIIQEGQRPPRPVEGENGENANNAVWCTDEVWDVLESSWLRVPAERLTMDEVSERLGHIDDERRDRIDSSGEATPRVASPVPMDVDEPEAPVQRKRKVTSALDLSGFGVLSDLFLVHSVSFLVFCASSVRSHPWTCICYSIICTLICSLQLYIYSAMLSSVFAPNFVRSIRLFYLRTPSHPFLRSEGTQTFPYPSSRNSGFNGLSLHEPMLQ